MNQEIGKCQISDSLIILMSVVIVTITSERLAKTMTIVKHGSYAIETETIKFELFQPIFAVGKQVVDDLILAIIETKGIPCWMFTTTSLHEVLATITGKVSQAFNLVLHGMRMHNVHDDSNAHLMRLVNEFLQFFWCTETAGRGKEVADMIAKRAIIGMFCHSHHLNGIIAIFLDSWQDVVLKFHI